MEGREWLLKIYDDQSSQKNIADPVGVGPASS